MTNATQALKRIDPPSPENLPSERYEPLKFGRMTIQITRYLDGQPRPWQISPYRYIHAATIDAGLEQLAAELEEAAAGLRALLLPQAKE